jgi:hypothetical protein
MNPLNKEQDMDLQRIITLRKVKEAEKPKLPNTIKFSVYDNKSPAEIEFTDCGAVLKFENYSYPITIGEIMRVMPLIWKAIWGYVPEN